MDVLGKVFKFIEILDSGNFGWCLYIFLCGEYLDVEFIDVFIVNILVGSIFNECISVCWVYWCIYLEYFGRKEIIFFF